MGKVGWKCVSLGVIQSVEAVHGWRYIGIGSWFFRRIPSSPCRAAAVTDDSYCLNTWNTAAVATHECIYVYIRERVDWNSFWKFLPLLISNTLTSELNHSLTSWKNDSVTAGRRLNVKTQQWEWVAEVHCIPVNSRSWFWSFLLLALELFYFSMVSWRKSYHLT